MGKVKFEESCEWQGCNSKSVHDMQVKTYNVYHVQNHTSLHMECGFPVHVSLLDISMSDVQIVNAVKQDGRLNALGCKILIKSNWNFNLLNMLCKSVSDREVMTFLMYGWPINRDSSPLSQTYHNHDSTNRYPH